MGTEKVKQKGTNGLKTETYITKMLNGKVISTKLLSRDTYDAMERIIIKGTKSANNKTTNVTEEQLNQLKVLQMLQKKNNQKQHHQEIQQQRKQILRQQLRVKNRTKYKR